MARQQLEIMVCKGCVTGRFIGVGRKVLCQRAEIGFILDVNLHNPRRIVPLWDRIAYGDLNGLPQFTQERWRSRLCTDRREFEQGADADAIFEQERA